MVGLPYPYTPLGKWSAVNQEGILHPGDQKILLWEI